MEDIYRNGNYRRKSSHRSKHSAKTVSYRPQYNSNNRNNKNRKRRKKAKRMEEPKLNKKKVFMVIAIPILIIMFINNKKGKNIEVSGKGTDIKESQSTTETNNINMPTQTTNTSTNSTQTTNKVEITDWKLRLANYDNLLPEDFEVELANIDNSKDPKQFDARAVKYLKDMINAMKKDGNTKIWCQSTFRSVKRQKELYDASVQKYLKQGKTQEEADIPEKEKESQQELQKQITIATQDKKVESPKQAEQSKVTQVITKQKTEINEQLKQDIKTETQIQEQTKFETKVEEKQSETPKCTDTNHGVGVGNSNKWFNSYNEAVSYYDNLILSYSNKVHNGEIIFEEYNKQCPCGYEIWSCQYCGKWTLNYYMR